MEVTLKEVNGIFSISPGEKLSTKEKENNFVVYANRKRTEKFIIILKCERNSADTLFAFKLVFKNKQLEKYSKAIAFEIYENLL
jgi:hypothetical protein